jgi:hypothetical protein
VRLATHKVRSRCSAILAARAAAGEMCRRCLKPIPFRTASGSCRSRLGARALAWAPALLRWARVTRGAGPMAVSRAPAPAGSWTSYFHLHLNFSAALRETASAHGRESASGRHMPHLWPLLSDRSGFPAMRHARGDGARAGPAQVSTTAIRALLSKWDGALPNSSRVPYGGRNRSESVQPRDLARWLSSRARSALALGELPRETRGRETLRLASQVGRFSHALPISQPIVEQRARREVRVALSTRRSVRTRTDLSSRSAVSTTHSLLQVGLAFPRTRMHETLREISRIPSPVQRIWRARDAEIAPSHASTRLQALAMKRPVDLVWRANTNATMTADAAPRSSTTSASSVRSAGAAVPSSPASRPDAKVVCATALDPALADRFADDVIRRIDRRARIERERRGL